MRQIQIECSVECSDELTVETLDRDTVRFIIAGFDTNKSVYMSEPEVRKLFNWLGVWLHGGNRG